MKKYKPANLQSVKEFIQRMLDGERFYDEDDKITFYFADSTFRYIDNYNNVHSFNPCGALIIKSLQVEITPTIQNAIAEKPRLCWVWNHEGINPKEYLQIIECYDSSKAHPFRCASGGYLRAELATLDDIKQFLED